METTNEQYIKDYLAKHFVKKYPYAVHYDDKKSAIIGSLHSTVTTDGYSYYKNGLNAKDFQKKYLNTPEWEELPLIGPLGISSDLLDIQ